MCGAVLPSNSLHAPPLGTPIYFPVYEAANELGCCVAIHGGVHGNMGMDGLDPYAAVHAIGHPLGQMISLASLVFNGVLERFPKIRFGFLEGGVAWLLFCLERFDRSYDTHVMRDLRGSYLKLEPGEKVSDYIIRHVKARRIFVGCEGGEPLIGKAVQMVGNEPFMYSSDFPHEVNAATCKKELNELIENGELSEAKKARSCMRMRSNSTASGKISRTLRRCSGRSGHKCDGRRPSSRRHEGSRKISPKGRNDNNFELGVFAPWRE